MIFGLADFTIDGQTESRLVALRAPHHAAMFVIK